MQCTYFDTDRCTSCALMGQPYADQVRAKQARVSDALGFPQDLWLPPFAGPESGFRNKAKLVVGGRRGAVTLGILDRGQRGVDLRACGLHEPGLAAAIPVLAAYVNDLGIEPYAIPERRGELKYVHATHSPDGELMVRFVLRTERHLEQIRDTWPDLATTLPGLRVVSVNLHPEHKAVLEGDTEVVLSPAQTLPMRLDDVTLHLAPRSFFQTNTTVAAGLYRQAQGWVADQAVEKAWDLYCGVGGFALHLAPFADLVIGIESTAEAVESARRAAAELGLGAERLQFVTGDATTAGQTLPSPDLVVVNPPRRGLGPDLTAWLDAANVPTVLYSSCNVESLARDLMALPTYRADAARLFDMFPQTHHHEVMVRLRKA